MYIKERLHTFFIQTEYKYRINKIKTNNNIIIQFYTLS